MPDVIKSRVNLCCIPQQSFAGNNLIYRLLLSGRMIDRISNMAYVQVEKQISWHTDDDSDVYIESPRV